MIPFAPSTRSPALGFDKVKAPKQSPRIPSKHQRDRVAGASVRLRLSRPVTAAAWGKHSTTPWAPTTPPVSESVPTFVEALALKEGPTAP